MMLMDSKGQLSVEYLLFVGFVLALILVIAVYVSEQNEQNIIASSIRVAAINTTTEMAVLNSTMHPVRVEESITTGTTNITIQIKLSNESLSSTQNQTILNNMVSILISQGYNDITNTQNGKNFTLTTSRHTYTISLA